MGTLDCGESWRTASVFATFWRSLNDQTVDLVYVAPPLMSKQNDDAFYTKNDAAPWVWTRRSGKRPSPGSKVAIKRS